MKVMAKVRIKNKTKSFSTKEVLEVVKSTLDKAYSQFEDVYEEEWESNSTYCS